MVGGLADDPKGAELLRGEWGGKLDKSLLIRTARDIAEGLVSRLPAAPPPCRCRSRSPVAATARSWPRTLGPRLGRPALSLPAELRPVSPPLSLRP